MFRGKITHRKALYWGVVGVISLLGLMTLYDASVLFSLSALDLRAIVTDLPVGVAMLSIVSLAGKAALIASATLLFLGYRLSAVAALIWMLCIIVFAVLSPHLLKGDGAYIEAMRNAAEDRGFGVIVALVTTGFVLSVAMPTVDEELAELERTS